MLAGCQLALPGLATPAPPTAVPQPFAISPASAASNLEILDSYRANLIVDFDGSRAGQPAIGRIESLTEVNRPARASHRYLNINADIPNLPTSRGVAHFYHIDDQIFVSHNGEMFQIEAPGGAISPESFGLLALEPLLVIPATVPDAPKIETIDGREVLHYRFNQQDLYHPDLHFGQAQGELWVAVPENYLLQYVISATLRMVNPLPTAHIMDQGQLTLSYKLTDINADISITPPSDTGGTPLTDFPPPPQSQLIAVYPTLVEYSSALNPISATLFYQAGLVGSGWSEESSQIFEEKSRLVFSKEDQRLTVLITPAGDSDNIKIVLDMGRD